MKNLFTLYFVLGLVCSCLQNANAQGLPDYVPHSGIVGWYPFDGSCEDLSVNQFDGTPVNVLWGQNRLGEPDAALDLTAIADDFVDLPAAVDSIFTSVITVACWVNYPAIPGQSIFQSGPTPGLYDKYHVTVWDQASTGNMTLRLYSESSSYTSYEYEEDEEWKHLEISYPPSWMILISYFQKVTQQPRQLLILQIMIYKTLIVASITSKGVYMV